MAHFSQLHSQDHLADVVREEVVREVIQVDEVVREEVVKEEEEDVHPEVAREEIVEYDEGVKAATSVRELERNDNLEVILIDQEIRNQGILIIEEPVVYC